MTLGELLGLLRGSILNDRTDRIAGSSDYLWTDETLVTFINEAQRRFAVQGLVLRDGSTDEATKIMLVSGQAVYPLHSSVFAVLSAKTETGVSDLKRVGHSFLNAYRQPTETWVDPATLAGLAPGAPLAYATDDELGLDDDDSYSLVKLRVYPTPDAAADGMVLRLRVLRRPIEPLDVNDLDGAPEIPSDHHIEMLDYAAYLALRIVDDDAGSPRRAADFLASFNDSVRQARALTMRKLFAPIGWGFGRGGFSWEH